MNYFYLSIDDNNNVIRAMNTFEEQTDMMEISAEEFQQVELYEKFDSQTRVFSDLRPQPPEPIDLKSVVIGLQQENASLLIDSVMKDIIIEQIQTDLANLMLEVVANGLV